MSIALGQIVLQKANKSHPCQFCKEMIEVGEIYDLAVGKSKKRFFSNRYHDRCWNELKQEKRLSLINAHKAIKNHTQKRKVRTSTLTMEQRARRKRLQTYLTTRDIPALIKAYEQHSTARVYKVMATIAERWYELHQMGVVFRTTLTSNKQTENDKKLGQLIVAHDIRWLDWVFKEDLTVEEKIAALVRTSETDQYPPQWPEKDTHFIATPIDPRDIKTYSDSEGLLEVWYGQDEHSVDVPQSEGLPDV